MYTNIGANRNDRVAPVGIRVVGRIALALVSLALHAAQSHAAATAPDDTAELFKVTCAICHEVPETKAPPVDTIRQLPAARILMAIEFGRMQPQAAGLTPEKR
jgi:mono/diheme cytochrome c family protein